MQRNNGSLIINVLGSPATSDVLVCDLCVNNYPLGMSYW